MINGPVAIAGSIPFLFSIIGTKVPTNAAITITPIIAPAIVRLIIRSWLNERPRSTLKISYMVKLKKTNELLASGYSIHAFVNSLGKPMKPPKIILDCLKKQF